MKIIQKLLVEKRLFTLIITFVTLCLGLLVQVTLVRTAYSPNLGYRNRTATSSIASKPVATKSAESTSSAASNQDPKTLGVSEIVPKKIVKKVPPPPTKPAVKIALGVASDNYNNQNGELSSLQQTLGIKLSSISMYLGFGDSFNSNNFTYAKSQGIKLLLAWEPWNTALSSISSGANDSYLQSFAQSIKQYGGAVTLRFGHEMNGDWYPWGNKPGDYIAAYRHIHDVFAGAGLTNVTWMWCPNVTWDGNNIGQYYPGNDIVDVIGIDGFNYGTSKSYGGWQTFSTILGPTYQFITTHYNKPLSIAESASAELGGDKANWVSTTLYTELPQKFPRIKEIVWFNILKAGEPDWRINSSPSSLTSFQNYFSN